jgi:hypothetical protein
LNYLSPYYGLQIVPSFITILTLLIGIRLPMKENNAIKLDINLKHISIAVISGVIGAVIFWTLEIYIT